MGLFRRVKERLEKRHAQKIDNLIKRMDQEIRNFSDKNHSTYFSEKNLDHINAILFEDEIWKIRQVYDKYKYEIEKLSKNDPEARKKFEETERKFIRRARLWHEFRKKGVNFPEKQMKELMALEANPHGEDRRGQLKVMENNFRVIAQAEGGIVQDIKRIKAKEKSACYIKEMLPAMKADEIWLGKIGKDVETMDNLNKQRESLKKHILANESKQATEGKERKKVDKSKLSQKRAERAR